MEVRQTSRNHVAKPNSHSAIFERTSAFYEKAAKGNQLFECAVNLKALDQCPRRRNVEHRLGHEGARQRRAVLLRTPHPASEMGKQCLDPHQFQDRDEELVALAHRTELALQPREQLLLKGVPVIR